MLPASNVPDMCAKRRQTISPNAEENFGSFPNNVGRQAPRLDHGLEVRECDQRGHKNAPLGKGVFSKVTHLFLNCVHVLSIPIVCVYFVIVFFRFAGVSMSSYHCLCGVASRRGRPSKRS